MLTFGNKRHRLPRMTKREFGKILREARLRRGVSLRHLADESGIEFSRLSRMEHGTRPAPGLPALRRLADLLSLDIVELLVSTGTPRESVEQLLWSQRLHEAKEPGGWAAYAPEIHCLRDKNRFIVRVASRQGAYCRATVGRSTWGLLTFSTASKLEILIPPEAVTIFQANPAEILCGTENVLEGTITKQRRFGALLNDVIAGEDIELNGVCALPPTQDPPYGPGDTVYLWVPAAAITTEPIQEEHHA